MKKVLLPLFLISASMGIIRLNAYCFYNHSNDETITVMLYTSKGKSEIAPIFNRKAHYVLSPKGNKACRNWRSVDKKDRKKEWYWEAFKGGKKVRFIWTKTLGEGYFPIGGSVLFMGYDANGRAKFDIYYDGKPWEYTKPPWNHRSRPWKTNKR